MKLRILIFLTVCVCIITAGFFWYKEATSPVNAIDPTTKIFVIKKGLAIRTLATELKNEGLIRDPLAFFILVKTKGVEKSIQAGDFKLSTAMSAEEVLDQLQHGTIDVWVTILEGWRNEEIALELARELAIPEQEFLAHAQEGYMFPDTYLFPRQASASAVAAKMHATFDKKVLEPYQDEISNNEMSLDEIVTLASLIERESVSDHDRPIVASVLLNRLAIGMKLDVDATVQYALGYQTDEKDWWKKSLLYSDLEFNSPYNTYKYAGFPPGPIANPGLSAIKAVLYPAETDYYYYIHDKNGTIYPARNLDEHQQNISTYL